MVSEKAEHTAHALARPARFSVEKDKTTGPDFTGPGRRDGSSYRVFALPLESPNDGPRTLVEGPAHQAHSPFGWPDLDGAKGPDTTITKGDNVHAYADTGDLGAGSYGAPNPPEYDNDAPDPDPHVSRTAAPAWTSTFHSRPTTRPGC